MLDEDSNMEVVSAAPPASGKSSRGKKQTGSILDMLKGKPASSKEKENVRNDEDEDESCAGANADNRKGKGKDKKEISEEELAVQERQQRKAAKEKKRAREEAKATKAKAAKRAARAAKAERKAQREAASTGKKSSKESKKGERTCSRFDSITVKFGKCKDLLKEIMKAEVELLKRRFDVYDCRWFTDPVDPVEMEIPDYPEIIKEPMCFLDIQKKFSRNVYERTEQYVADMRLVFTNATTYNSDQDNPVHVAALHLSDLFETRYKTISYSWESSAHTAGGYVDIGSDDEQFVIPSDESSEDEKPKRKDKPVEQKAVPSANAKKTAKGTKGGNKTAAASPCSGDQEVISVVDSEDSNEFSDSSDDDGGKNGDEIEYRIQHILCSKSLFPFEWQTICEKMNTREVTRGSVWKQPDNEFFDKAPRKVEKFLIKWMHASYLHLSWEKEDDLMNLIGATAKTAIKKHRLRVVSGGPDIFEDLARGETFPSSFLRIERILDVEDNEVSLRKVDYINAQPKLVKDERVMVKETSPIKDKSVDEGSVLPDSPFSALAKRTTKDNVNMESPTDLLVSDCFSPVQEAATLPIKDVVKEEENMEIDYVADGGIVQNETSLDGFDLDMEGDDAILSSPGLSKGLDVVTCALPLEQDVDTPESRNASVENSFIPDIVQGNDDGVDEETIDKDSGVRKSCRIKKSVQIIDPQIETSTTAKKTRTPRSAKKANSAPKVKKDEDCDPLVLHGTECWVTVKWEGLPYEDCSFEDLADIRSTDVEYQAAMRAFYKREQRTPVVRGRPRKVKRSLDNEECNSKESPKFPTGELRDYQWEGVRWLLFNWSQRRNSILADEMGLGKTIQSAGFLQLLKRHQGVTGPFLIVAPLSTIVNWQRELDEWTDMDSVIYHGSVEDRQLIREHEFYYMSRNKKDGHKVEIVITTPETCLAADSRTPTGRVHRELAQIDWDVLIVDEAHKLKNHSSKFTSTIRGEFSYQSCLLLTGTPLQNNTDELWTLLNFVDKNKFDDKDKFAVEYGELKTAAQLEKIHKLIRPYILRREKENVEKSVPPKEEVIVEVELTIPQKQYYRAIYEQNTQFLYKSGAKDGPRLSNLAMELRKCCNHPFLVKGAEMDIIRQAQQDEALNNSETGYVDTLVGSSGKMVLLDKLLPKLKSQGHRVLIFSQFRIMLDIIEDYLIMKKMSYDRVDGTVTGKKRQSAIDKYSDTNSDVFCMLLSTRAGGVGINLTAADTVIIFDSDWNPQNDLQAQARAHRIGQTKSVKVYRLLTKKSYEMHMFHTASVKLGLAYAIAGGKNPNEIDTDSQKNKNFSSLSKKELENLLKHGAYDIFNESKDGTGEDESRNFCDADIDSILERSSVVIHDSKGSTAQTSSFSKASFVASGGEENNIDLEDPEFWAKVVGLGYAEEEELTGRRRKCRELVGEGSYKEPGMRFATYQSSSDSDSDAEESRPREKRAKKEKPSFAPADFTDTHQMTRLTNVLLTRGYGNWASIRKDARLKWTQADIAKGCRTIIIQQLITAFDLESFDGFSKSSSGGDRLSFTGVADRLSLSPCATEKGSSSGGQDGVLNFMAKMHSCKVARLALAAALLDSNSHITDESIALTDLITPYEDKIIADTIIRAKCEVTDNCIAPLVVFRESTTCKEWNSSYFDRETIDESFSTFNDKTANVIMTVKSMCPEKSIATADVEGEEVTSSGSDTAVVKAKAARSRAEERLAQLEDMFELQMAAIATSATPPAPPAGASVAEAEGTITGANDIDTTTPSKVMEVDSTVSNEPNKPEAEDKAEFVAVISEPQNFVEYLKEIFDKEESVEQPFLSIRVSYPWWKVEHDAALIAAVQNVGWPDSKKKFSAIEIAMARTLVEPTGTDGASTYENENAEQTKEENMDIAEDAKQEEPTTKEMEISTEEKIEPGDDEKELSAEDKAVLLKEKAEKEAAEDQELIKKAFPTGFPFKDRMDMAKRLRAFTTIFRSGMKHTSSSSCSKKLAQSVLKAMSKLGRPRTLYSEMIDGQCAQGITCTNDECDEAHLYRSEYLLNWEELTKECGVKVLTPSWVNRVKSIVKRILAGQEEAVAIQKAKGTSFTDPDSILTLAEVSVKYYVDALEKSEMMHRVRAALAAFPDDYIIDMIRGNNKIPLTGPADPNIKPVILRKGEKERERDAGMPVWWQWEHDVALLKIVTTNGLANCKKLLADASSFTEIDITTAPVDFETPPKASKDSWQVVKEAAGRKADGQVDR